MKKSLLPFFCTALLMMLFSVIPVLGQGTLKIMPLGNSMTEGWMDGTELPQDRVGYRKVLKAKLDSAHYLTDFVGSKTWGSQQMADYQNAGIDGTRDDYIENMLITGYDLRWGVQETTGPYLDAFNPDIILLDVGTNDITHEPDAIANQRISGILDQVDAYEIRAHKPVIVFLALIINRRRNPDGSEIAGSYTTTLWNQAINAMALIRIQNGDKLVVVDMENGAGFNYSYNGGDMYQPDPEGLHPSPKGYTKMANQWFKKFAANYNSAPVITPIPDQSTAEGTDFSTINLDNYVTDVEDADQYITWTTSQISTSNLNIAINASRQAVITPKDPNWSGTQNVIFTATDRGRSGNFIKSDADTVLFTITPVNDPPVVSSQSALSTIEDSYIVLDLSDFTVTDPDSDPSTFQLVVLPGTDYTVNGTKVTPTPNYYGNLYVNVAVRDAQLQGPTFVASVTVTGVNDPPAFVSQPEISIDEDATYTVDLANLNVTDPDNTIAQLTIVMLPGPNYTIDGNVVRPDPNFNGTLNVESYLRDPSGAVSPHFYLAIQVNPENDPPVFTSEPVDSAHVEKQYIYAVKISDPDVTDVITVTILLKPAWLVYYPNSRLLAGTPQKTDAGNSSVFIRVSDGHVNVDQSYVLHVYGASAVTEINGDSKVDVYPNPVSDRISFTIKDRTTEIKFELFDMTGKSVLQKLFCADCETSVSIIDLGLAPGAYIYKLTSSENTYTGKLLINSQY